MPTKFYYNSINMFFCLAFKNKTIITQLHCNFFVGAKFVCMSTLHLSPPQICSTSELMSKPYLFVTTSNLPSSPVKNEAPYSQKVIVILKEIKCYCCSYILISGHIGLPLRPHEPKSTIYTPKFEYRFMECAR
jgi:hypothetical protein